MKAIILAAGYATRLYPLTKTKAKALLPVSGRPIIDHIIEEIDTIQAVDQLIVISNHRFIDQFNCWAEDKKAKRAELGKAPLLILDDQTMSDMDKLGAIGDIQFCIEQLNLNDDLLIVAGDSLFTFSLHAAWREFVRTGKDMIMVKEIDSQEDLKRFAVVLTDKNNDVIDMEEKPNQPKSNLACFAIYFYRKDTLPLIGQYLAEGNSPDAPGYFPSWLYKKKPVHAYKFTGTFIDIGTPESYEDVRTTFPPVRDKRT